MEEKNGNILANQFTMLGLPCVFKTARLTPQFCMYMFDCKDISIYSKKLVERLLEKIRAYNHLDYQFIDSDESHFAITCPYETKSLMTIADVGFGYVGKDMYDRDFKLDFNKISHILVAGTTGSGKSVFLTTLLNEIVLSGEPFSFVLIDPKRISFTAWEQTKCAKVITDVGDAYYYLERVASLMEERYNDIKEGKVKEQDLPHIFVVIDELADLMLQTRFECENTIIKLVQKARQVKIHLILATQRPTANVVSGMIKANCDTKICFRVASVRDSVVILDHKGGEKLFGYGDCIVQSGGKETRVQIAYSHDEITQAIIDKTKGVA